MQSSLTGAELPRARFELKTSFFFFQIQLPLKVPFADLSAYDCLGFQHKLQILIFAGFVLIPEEIPHIKTDFIVTRLCSHPLPLLLFSAVPHA